MTRGHDCCETVQRLAHGAAEYKKLIESVELTDVSSSVAMEKLKSTMALPHDYV